MASAKKKKVIAYRPAALKSPAASFPWQHAIALFFLAVLTYLPSIGNGFIWDDPAYVIDNPTLKTAPGVTALDGLWRIWSDYTATPQYYPLVHTTFWIEARLWGTNQATGFHVNNILLHALAAVLLWRVLAGLKVPWPWLAAAIFAVHPVMVESVTWVTERKNVLSIVFYLLAFHAYRRSGWLDEKKVDRRWYTASLLFFLLALLSKTVTCSLPAAILLIVWWKRGRIARRDIVPLLPMFAVGLCLSMFTSHLEHTRVGAHGPDFQWSPIDRCLIAGHAICFYAGKMIWPHPLIFMYPHWDLHDHRGLQLIYPVIVIVIVFALWLSRARIGRGPLVAVLFFIGTLVPALGFVNVYPMRYSFVADHFQYLASIGMIVLISAGLCRLSRSISPRLILSVVLALLISLTVWQQTIYKDQETLWKNTLAQNPTCWMAHINLAGVYGREKKLDAAIDQSQQALKLAPHEADTQYDMGVAMALRSLWPQAIDFFREAIHCDPERSQAWSYLALLLWEHPGKTADRDEAVRDADHALQLSQNLSAPHYVLGLFAESKHDLAGAIEEYRKALEVESTNYPAHYRLGLCLLKNGDPGDAAGEFKRLIDHDSNDYLAWTALGDASRAAGLTQLAVQSYQRAIMINPGDKEARDGLSRMGK